MSNIIQFLEALGANSSFDAMSAERYAASVQALELAPEQQRALLDRDVQSLARSMDGRSRMFCMIIAPDGAEEQDLPGQQEDQGDGDKEDEES